MRSLLYAILAAAGTAGIVVLVARLAGARRSNPIREAERLVDRCQEMLTRLEAAARGFQGTEPAES